MNNDSLFIIQRSLFNIHFSLFNIHYSIFIIHHNLVYFEFLISIFDILQVIVLQMLSWWNNFFKLKWLILSLNEHIIAQCLLTFKIYDK